MLRYSRRVLGCSAQVRNLLQRRTVLSAAFAADEAWASRHKDIKKLGLGGDYEWISAVQKKFIGGGVASAVDVDTAVCVAEHKDQVDDVVELVYKLRHSENAAEQPPSSEYALIRLLLKHEPERIFQLADDPINYGVFMNEHSACLSIDHFLKRDNIQGAARLASWVMQQEMTSNELVNLLCLYATTKWAELAKDAQTMPLRAAEEEEESDEDEKVFKFPYLKNDHFDDHFDLVNPQHLAGKTLLWVARDCKTIDQVTRDSLSLLGAVLYDRWTQAVLAASPSVLPGAAKLVRQRIEDTVAVAGEGATPTEQQQKILDSLGPVAEAESTSLSDEILKVLKSVQTAEEAQLVERQTAEFGAWSQRRVELVDAQAERVLLKVKMEEIEAELKQLAANEEKFSFFENRLQWEKRATANDEIEVPEDKAKESVA